MMKKKKTRMGSVALRTRYDEIKQIVDNAIFIDI
jgi:hypothetical protein